MAQKTMNAFVVIGGRVDNSFGKIGTALISLGSTVDQVSRKLIDFGKEGADVYKSYEDSMLAAEGALATSYGQGTRELKSVMAQLDAAAADWANSTIFHTDDVADAINNAAHANWDLDQIMTGIPNVMKLAEAGGMDLSRALEYVVSSTKAAGIGFDELDTWIDLWAYAANSSAGTIEEFGDAFERMGSTMTFADGMEEILTLLAALHDTGTKGASAGTLLRNTMIRLLAPTQKASEMMESLGLTEDEIDEAMGEVSGDMDAAIQSLDNVGFSAYDAEGNLKGFVQIFKELSAALDGMTEGEMNNVLSSIFPTRTITGALAFLTAATNDFNGLFDDLKNGKAAGYADYVSDLAMSGLTGAEELLASKIENLKLMVGENLAPQIESIANNIGVIIDHLTSAGASNGVSAGLGVIEKLSGLAAGLAENLEEMDPMVFDALCEAAGALAGLGPGLILTGTAFRFVGFALGTLAGRIALLTALVATAASALDTLREGWYKDNFGNMALDTAPLNDYLDEIQQHFDNSTASITAYKDALDESARSYMAASEAFSSAALTDILTQKAMTQDDLDRYVSLGQDMVNSVKRGIEDGADMSAEFWTQLFLNRSETDEDLVGNSIYAGIIAQLNAEKEESLAQVEAIGAQIQDVLMRAFNNGELTSEDRAEIKSYIRSMNEAMLQAQREAQDEQDYIARRRLMDKATSLSYDEMKNFIDDEITPQRQAQLDFWTDGYKEQIYALDFWYDKKIAEAEDEQEKQVLSDERDRLKNGAQSELNEKLAEIYADYDRMILDLMGTTLDDGDLGDAAALWDSLMSEVQAGRLTGQLALDTMNEQYGQKFLWFLDRANDKSDIRGYERDTIDKLGGREEVERRITFYRDNGDERTADELQTLLDSESLLSERTYETSQSDEQIIKGMTPEQMMDTITARSDAGDADMADLFDAVLSRAGHKSFRDALAWLSDGEAEFIDGVVDVLERDYDFERLNAGDGQARADRDDVLYDPDYNRDYDRYYSAFKLMSMSADEREAYRHIEPYETEVSYPGAADGASETKALPTATISPIEAEVSYPGAAEGMSETKALLTETISPIEAEVSYPGAVEGAAALHHQIEGELTPLTQSVRVVGWTSVTAPNIPQKARGGRETQPSLFAEAGIPEWYIPEEHTDNTARLILGAAYGSGFDIYDLAAMAGARLFEDGGTSGGAATLNWGAIGAETSGGASGGGSIQVQYSPVIHAEGNGEIAKTLKEDKKRLEKWMNEWWERRALYESVVAY